MPLKKNLNFDFLKLIQTIKKINLKNLKSKLNLFYLIKNILNLE